MIFSVLDCNRVVIGDQSQASRGIWFNIIVDVEVVVPR